MDQYGAHNSGHDQRGRCSNSDSRRFGQGQNAYFSASVVLLA
jgi:hypothetical protein